MAVEVARKKFHVVHFRLQLGACKERVEEITADDDTVRGCVDGMDPSRGE